ncbi:MULTISPECIES: DUF357 domain-containing protein [unclassified Methanoregula]|uniref:DUF357 domain-containing protein n=1 Tax=unclassified Methanoregula TaxID=2649730 RepID=UPI0009CA06B4|nr:MULTISPECIES: DUF357 domain-containing protein [unclassified Methanoregula]OPX64940.1 MAG: hypothetical protein A4E33_00678 [Methanoregula sp. PtaB.Bin085]OPY32992.1 MAG: hypothetical protein A4E34_02369 [Methanoregula sp. PtaU1.Bin006]
MKTGNCLDLLATLADTASVMAPEGTPLHRSADAVLVMARAYERDGRTFLVSGDPVNALACAWYGSGWLHFGISYGLLETGIPAGCPFLSPCEIIPPQCTGKLDEKTRRYQRLLDTAQASVKTAGEPATIHSRFADQVLFITSLYALQGGRYLMAGKSEDALACFSYGHGWLDAGVTAGLFTISDHHDLFTV